MIGAAIGVLALVTASIEAPYQRLSPGDYQSFVGNWAPNSAPLCAALRSGADWERVLHPAPTMWRHKPFAPSAAFWTGHAVLLVARVANAGPTADILTHEHVRRAKDALEVDYAFRPTPPASSTIKWYLALAVPRPLPPEVRFKEGGRLVCTLKPAAGVWLIPKP